MTGIAAVWRRRWVRAAVYGLLTLVLMQVTPGPDHNRGVDYWIFWLLVKFVLCLGALSFCIEWPYETWWRLSHGDIPIEPRTSLVQRAAVYLFLTLVITAATFVADLRESMPLNRMLEGLVFVSAISCVLFLLGAESIYSLWSKPRNVLRQKIEGPRSREAWAGHWGKWMRIRVEAQEARAAGRPLRNAHMDVWAPVSKARRGRIAAYALAPMFLQIFWWEALMRNIEEHTGLWFLSYFCMFLLLSYCGESLLLRWRQRTIIDFGEEFTPEQAEERRRMLEEERLRHLEAQPKRKQPMGAMLSRKRTWGDMPGRPWYLYVVLSVFLAEMAPWQQYLPQRSGFGAYLVYDGLAGYLLIALTGEILRPIILLHPNLLQTRLSLKQRWRRYRASSPPWRLYITATLVFSFYLLRKAGLWPGVPSGTAFITYWLYLFMLFLVCLVAGESWRGGLYRLAQGQRGWSRVARWAIEHVHPANVASSVLLALAVLEVRTLPFEDPDIFEIERLTPAHFVAALGASALLVLMVTLAWRWLFGEQAEDEFAG